MQNQRSEKKFYKSIKFWIILIASIAFLIVWGIESEKNAPPSYQHSLNNLSSVLANRNVRTYKVTNKLVFSGQ